MSSKHPEIYKPYRLFVYVTFIVVIVFLSLLPLMGVARGLLADSRVTAPPRSSIVLSPSAAELTPREAEQCLLALDALRREILSRFAHLGELAGHEGRDALRVWAEETRVWEATRSSLADECKVESENGGPFAASLAPVASSLERMGRVFSSHATRLVMEDAAVFEEVRTAFLAARASLRDPKPAKAGD